MKAVVQERYGSVDDLEVREVGAPSIGEGEVRVRVRASSVHPDVWHVVTGRPWVVRVFGMALRRPRNPIPGTDMAGVVESVGPGATRFQPGDEVFGETRTGNQWGNGGAWAELVSAREEWLAPKPPDVSFEEAASVPTSGFIALFNLRDPSVLEPGQRILVNGAGGGVGSIALQIAKARDAHVTAVDSSAKLQMLRDLGADEVLDYAREDFTRLGRTWDLVFDVPGSRPYSEIRRALAPDGRYIPIGHEHFGAAGRRVLGMIPHFMALMLRQRLTGRPPSSGLPAPGRGDVMATLASLLEDGTLTPVIDSTFPLERAREAMRRMIDGEPLGKVMIVVSEEDG